MMRDTIKHFMWGYQRHFRHTVERETQRVLESLKRGLDPKVFLVGVRVSNSENLLPACVEPEVHHWARSEDFYDVLGDVEAIQDSYPESQLFHSHPIAQQRADEGLFRRALRDAVLQRLERCEARPEHAKIFISYLVERDGFLIYIVTVVDDRVFGTVQRLDSDKVWIHDHRSFSVPQSLVDAVIEQIHARAREIALQSDAGAGLEVLGSGDEITRRAGVRFFSGLLHRVDRESMIVGVAEEVFDTIARLVLTPYEGAEPEGTLVFVPEGGSVGTTVLSLATPLPLRQRRALRKLLVLANERIILRCDTNKVVSLEEATGTIAGIKVQVIGRGEWVVSVDDQELMVIKDGRPALPEPVVDEQQVARDLRRLIPSMSTQMAERFACVGARLATSGHGGLIVVTEKAVEEAIRLGDQSLPIMPLSLTPDLASRLTEIDGALLCDPDGLCHAIGVILDGRASASGDRGRGSRFNSALRYIESNLAAAMVVSEDGGLDLLPRLKPMVSRDVLESRLEELHRLASSPAEPSDRDREVDIIEWLRNHSFYLDETQCKNANLWIGMCDERFFEESAMRIEQPPLKPDPNFDPSRDLS